MSLLLQITHSERPHTQTSAAQEKRHAAFVSRNLIAAEPGVSEGVGAEPRSRSGVQEAAHLPRRAASSCGARDLPGAPHTPQRCLLALLLNRYGEPCCLQALARCSNCR